MRHPPLDHLAASAAQFLTGWELLHDAGALTRLGPGRLELDLLRGSCHHQLRYIPPLKVAGVLRHRLLVALDEIPLDWSRLLEARAGAEMTLALLEQSDEPGPRETAWAGVSGPMIRCTLDVKLTLATDEGRWAGSYRGGQAWPRDWALTR